MSDGVVEVADESVVSRPSYRSRRRAKKSLRSKLRRRLTRVGIAVILLVVIVVGGTGGYLYYRLGKIARVKVKVTPVASSGVEDILLVGSTSRCAVTPAKNFQNFVKQCEEGVNGVNSDVIMILRLVPNRAPTLLSIPRDTFVPDARAGGLSNKVDAALADGPSQLVAAIQQDFGIPINHYVVLNFQTFANIVTALGGITMYFPTTLLDKDSGLSINHSGCLHISGLEALALVRSRHLYYHYDYRTRQWRGYDPTGDIGRIERVHIFLKVLGAEIAKRGLSNPITDNALLSAIAPDLTLDTTFSTSEMLHLLLAFHAKIGSIRDFTLPVVEDAQTYYYKGYNYGLVVFPSQPQDAQTINSFMGRPAGVDLKPASISVSVVDGTGSATATATTAAHLHSLGYTVTATGTQTSVGPISETAVVYASSAHLVQAERVLGSVSGTAVLAKGPTVDGADVTVITGTDLSVVGSEGASTITTSSTSVAHVSDVASAFATLVSKIVLSAAGPASVGASPTSAALSAPTPSSPKIAPFDPRACPAK